MRSLLVVVAALVGCTGEQVIISPTDTGSDMSADSATDSSVPNDTSVADTTVADTALSDAIGADTSDASCPTYAGNLIPDGDFSTGFGAWRATDCQVERVAGRCGQAMRMYNITAPARVNVDYSSAPVAKGTKLHLRAWFKKGMGPAPGTPRLFIRSYFNVDGGEDYKDYEVFGTLTDSWTLADRVFTMDNAQTGMQVFVDVWLGAEVTTPHDLLVADISLVPEP